MCWLEYSENGIEIDIQIKKIAAVFVNIAKIDVHTKTNSECFVCFVCFLFFWLPSCIDADYFLYGSHFFSFNWISLPFAPYTNYLCFMNM